MQIVSVTIQGKTPILLHNPAGMAGRKPGKTEIPTPEAASFESCYWTPEKDSLGFPGDNVKASMLVASTQYKAGKIKLGPFIAGSVFIEPAMLSFNTKEYEIDTRRAVIQRQGILRSRARISKWKLTFDLIVDDDFPATNIDVLKEILSESGRRVGIGDYRPQRKGWFGKFEVIDWKVKSNGRR